jgi:CRP-like cAMP-binding protein
MPVRRAVPAVAVRYPARVARDKDSSVTDRLTRQGEEALGKIAEELIGNPVVNSAVTRALEAREKAVQAQEAAMGALNIPSAADVERLTRRLRSVSQRLEGIEDSLDRIEQRAQAAAEAAEGNGTPSAVSVKLEDIARDLAALRDAVVPAGEPMPRAQERLTVTERA